MDENASLVFGVKTQEAVSSLDNLERKLDSVLAKFGAVASQGVPGMAAASSLAVRESRALADEIEATSRTTTQAGQAAIGLRERFGAATASTRLGIKATADELASFQKEVRALASDRSTALGFAKAQAEMEAQANAAMSRHEKRRKAQLALNTRYDEMEFASRVRVLERMAKLQDKGWQGSSLARRFGTTAFADSANLTDYRAQLLNQRVYDAERLRQTRAGIMAEEKYTRTARERELASLRAHIKERADLENAADRRHEARRASQAQLNMRYDQAELSARIRTLQAIQNVVEANNARMAALASDPKARVGQIYSTSDITRRYGTSAMRDMGNLSAYRAEAAAIKQLEAERRRLDTLARQGASDTDRNSQALRNNAGAMRDVHGAARGLSGSLGALWMTYGALGPLLAGAALGTIIRETYRVGQDVEYRLQMLKALGNAAASVNDLMPAVHGSMRTPLEAAEGLQTLAQAGLKTQEALTALGPTLQLSTLGEMSVADAALTATSAMSTFKLEVYDMTRIGDLFAKGASTSNASVQEIAESLKQAGAAAATYGLSLEDTIAQITALAQSGVKGSAAGTAIKNAMTELYAPTKKASDIMQQIGLRIYDQEGKARPYLEILKDLKATMATMGTEQQNQLLGRMFNERSRRGIQIMLNDMKTLEDMAKGLGDPTGYLARANEMLLDTVTGSLNRFQSVLQQSYVQAFDELKPQIRGTIADLESFVGGEGFVSGVQRLGSAVSTLTSFFAENSSAIAIAAGAFVVLKTAQIGAAAATSLMANATIASTARQMAWSAMVSKGTLELNTNTASRHLNTIAINANNAAASRSTTVMAAAGVGIRALGSIAGVAGIAISALSLALYALNRDTGPVIDSTDRMRERVDAVTNSIRNEIKAIEDRRAARLRDAGMTPETERTDRAGIREAATQYAAATQMAKDELDTHIEMVRGLSHIGREEMIVHAARTRALQAEYERRKAISDSYTQSYQQSEQARVEGERQRARAESEDRLESLRRRLDQERDMIAYSPAGHAQRNFTGPLDSMDAQVKDLLAEIDGGSNVSRERIDELAQSFGALQRQIEETRATTFNLDDDRPTAGFRAAVQNITEAFNQEKRILEEQRNFQLEMSEARRSAGLQSNEQAAANLRTIWEDYQKSLVDIAAKAEKEISALPGAGDEAKEFRKVKIEQKVASERRMAVVKMEQDVVRRAAQAEIDAIKQVQATRVSLGEAERTMAQQAKDDYEALARLYMTDEQVAVLDARNQAEAEYLKIIEEIQKKLSEGRVVNPQFDLTEAGQALLNQIPTVERQMQQASDAAASRMQQISQITSSSQHGAMMALNDYQKTAMNSAEQTRNIWSKAFKSMEDGIVQAAMTGEISVRNMVDGIVAEFIRMNVQQFVLGPLAQMMYGGGMAGGAAPQTTAQAVGGIANSVAQAVNTANSLNTLYGTATQFLYGASTGASSASLAAANVAKFFGGDGIGTLIAGNGGWAGVGATLGSTAAAAGTGLTLAGALTPAVGSIGSAALGGTLASSMAGAGTVSGLATGAATGVGSLTSLGIGATGSTLTGAGTVSGILSTTATTAGTAATGAAATGVAATGATATGTAAAAGGAAAGAGAGIMSTMAAIAPYALAALAVYTIAEKAFGGFAAEKRFGGSYMLQDDNTAVRTGGPSGNLGDDGRVFSEKLLLTAQDMITRGFSSAGIDSELSNLTIQFENSDKGRGGVSSFVDVTVDGQTVRAGAEGKGKGHGGTSGSLEEMAKNVEIDMYQTVIQSWQTAIDTFPEAMAKLIRGVDADSLGLEGAQGLVEKFVALGEGLKNLSVLLGEMPFVQAEQATFDYAAALAEASGGADTATTRLNNFYGNFFTAQERGAKSVNLLAEEFKKLDKDLPRTRAEYREMVEEAINLGEEGSKTAAQLLALGDAMSSVLPTFEDLEALMKAISLLPFATAATNSMEYVSELAKFTGGAGPAASMLGNFYENFYSEEERTANLTRVLTDQFKALNLVMPQSRAEYRQMVEVSMNLGEAGAETTAQLLAFESSLNQVLPAVGEVTAAVQRMLEAFTNQSTVVQNLATEAGRLSQLRNTGGNLMDRINKELGKTPTWSATREAELWAAMTTASYQQQIDLASELTDIILDRYKTETENAQRLADIGKSLRTYIEGLKIGDMSPYTLSQRTALAENRLIDTIKAAQGGDVSAAERIQSELEQALSLWREYGASGAEYQDAFFRLTGMADGFAINAISDAEKQLGVSQEMLAQLQTLGGYVQAAVDAVNERYGATLISLDNEMKSLIELGLQTDKLGDIEKLMAGMPAGIAAILQPLLNAAYDRSVNQWYEEGLGRPADSEGWNYWRDEINKVGIDNAKDRFNDAAASNGELVKRWYSQYATVSPDSTAIDYWANEARLYGVDVARSRMMDALRANGELKVSGSHRSGRDYVPYDNYLAYLHKGEKVLTAPEARAHDAGSSDDEVVAVLEEVVEELALTRDVLARVIGAASAQGSEAVVEGVRLALENSQDRNDMNRKRVRK